ncbi:MAG: hypothetical protein AAGJ83_07935 [Planctomycetota bacterium]
MHSLILVVSLFGAVPTPPALIAESIDSSKVIVMDQATADLLAQRTACVRFRILVHSESDTLATLDRRALALQDADYVLFRSDRISVKSQMLRERLSNHGICHVDVLKLFPKEQHRAPAPNRDAPYGRFLAVDLSRSWTVTHQTNGGVVRGR